MRDDVEQAVEYLSNPDRLRSYLEQQLWDGFSSVFLHPDVMDSNFATTLVVANSNFHKVTWTMAGQPTVLGTTFEQGTFASNFFCIADIVELARVKEFDAFPGIEVPLLKEFAKAVMLVRSGVEDSSPQLGVLRNELLGQLDFLGKAIKLKASRVGVPDETSLARGTKVDTRIKQQCEDVDGRDLSLPGNEESTQISEGPDDLRLILVLKGHKLGPFTPTQFDVIQAMWENRESAWSESNAFFTFHQKWGWSQTDGGPFGKHQTAIQSVFEQKGFGLPWKRGRGAFVWCGLVPPKAKRVTKAKVSRSKKR